MIRKKGTKASKKLQCTDVLTKRWHWRHGVWCILWFAWQENKRCKTPVVRGEFKFTKLVDQIRARNQVSSEETCFVQYAICTKTRKRAEFLGLYLFKTTYTEEMESSLVSTNTVAYPASMYTGHAAFAQRLIFCVQSDLCSNLMKRFLRKLLRNLPIRWDEELRRTIGVSSWLSNDGLSRCLIASRLWSRSAILQIKSMRIKVSY